MNNPLHIWLIVEHKRIQGHIIFGGPGHMHGVDSIWAQWIVANSKTMIAAVRVKESSKTNTLYIGDTIDDWIAFHWKGKKSEIMKLPWLLSILNVIIISCPDQLEKKARDHI